MLNQIINLFWTIACFIPIGWYWGLYLAEKRSHWILIMVIILSMLVYLLPAKWLDILTLSKQRKTYEKLGLKSFRYFVQNGTLVNRLKSKQKRYGIIHNREHAIGYLQAIAMQERFHYCCLILFTLTTICAFMTNRPLLGTVVLLSNILYNIFPILLQQYNRLRINATIGGKTDRII
jgi:hypothetical protein